MGTGLFPEPIGPTLALSRLLGAEPGYRLAPGEHARWTRRNTASSVDCEECAALQHELRGAYRPRRRATIRRTRPGPLHLDLCSAHAELWRERDDANGANT
jgi:hypothetical protein